MDSIYFYFFNIDNKNINVCTPVCLYPATKQNMVRAMSQFFFLCHVVCDYFVWKVITVFTSFLGHEKRENSGNSFSAWCFKNRFTVHHETRPLSRIILRGQFYLTPAHI